MSHSMYRILSGLGVIVALMAGVAILARLPVSQGLIDVIALIGLVAIAIAIEWPRWVHKGPRKWPNKLGEL